MDTQTQIERLIELAIVQRTELKELVAQLPQLREHLSTEIEKAFDEAEPQLRAELEEWTTKQAADKTAALGVTLEAKIADLAKSLEISTQARYNAIIAEREENARLAAQAEAKIAEHAASLPSAVKEIVSAELARFPRAGEIDQLRKEFAEPRGLNPRGKWQAGETYNRLDLVTVNGDSFVSNIDGNKERPSRSATNWTLSAARGMGGGSGFTSLNNVLGDPSAGQIVGSEGGQYVRKTLVAGANITINETASAITIIGDEGQISLNDGTAASPALFFTNDTDTGIYRPAANTLGISVSGTQVAYFDANGITTVGAGATFDGSVHAANGNANNPSFSFTSDQDTGFYRHGTNELGISIGGTQKAVMTSTTFTVTPNLVVSGSGSINGTTIPASKTLVVTTDKLSALASTSSSELAGVISDETGTGALVFANTPTLVTPNIGAATGTSFNLTGSGTLGTTLTVNSTTDSSSKDTGAIVTEGGLGVEKSATFGGNLTVSGTATVNGSTIRAAAGTNGAARGLEFYNTGNSALFGTIKADYTSGIIAYDAGAAVYGSNHVFTHGTTAGSVTLSAGSITATGNLTVSGAGTNGFKAVSLSDGATYGGLTLNGAIASGTMSGIYGGGDSNLYATAPTSVWILTAGTERARFTSTATTLAGNLTVSGTGTSSFAGNVTVTGTGTNYTAVDTGSFVRIGNNQTGANLQLGSKSGTGAILQGAADGLGAYALVAQPYGGNFLIGTTTDTGYKLNVKGASDTQMMLDVASGSQYTTLAFANNGSGKGFVYWDNSNNGLFAGTYASNASLKFNTGLGVLALTLDSSQNATFAGTGTFSGASLTLSNSTDPRLRVVATGSTTAGLFLSPNNNGGGWTVAAAASATPDLIVYDPTAGGTEKFRIYYSSGNIENTGSIKTGAPTGGTAKPWKVGQYNSTAPSATGYVEVDINGTLYKLLAST